MKNINRVVVKTFFYVRFKNSFTIIEVVELHVLCIFYKYNDEKTEVFACEFFHYNGSVVSHPETDDYTDRVNCTCMCTMNFDTENTALYIV